VKDVERIGDYAKNLSEVPEIRSEPLPDDEIVAELSAKNLSEVPEIRSEPLPDDEIVAELREIRAGVEAAFSVTAESFEALDRDRAVALIQQGKDVAHRCDALIETIARSDHNARTTTALVLGTRFYKRFGPAS
jgi:phosphate uptake regulator